MTFQSIPQSSKIRQHLGNQGTAFLEHAMHSVNRILPHTMLEWSQKQGSATTGAAWESERRRAITIKLNIDDFPNPGRHMLGILTRTNLSGIKDESKTLGNEEIKICQAFCNRLNGLLKGSTSEQASLSLSAIKAKLDEQIVATYLRDSHKIAIDMIELFDAIHKLSELTYENQSIAFGCIIDPDIERNSVPPVFPYPLLEMKKYRALTDGFRTAYLVSGDGAIHETIDLDAYAKTSSIITNNSNFPYWTAGIAMASKGNKVGIALTRQGDILVFENGMLRLSYRFGKWQHWHHSHLKTMLSNLCNPKKMRFRYLAK